MNHVEDGPVHTHVKYPNYVFWLYDMMMEESWRTVTTLHHVTSIN